MAAKKAIKRFEPQIVDIDPVFLEPVKKLKKDVVSSMNLTSQGEVRFAVDNFYKCQEDRKRSDNQLLALTTNGEPGLMVQYLAEQAFVLESSIKKCLKSYAEGHPVGRWLMSNFGIAEVLTAGFLAHIDITKAPTAGHILSFAGQNPNVIWRKGEKRPWNAKLKVLCFKFSDVAMKFSNNENCTYGKLYREFKEEYVRRNEAGAYQERARAILASGKFKPKSNPNKVRDEEAADENGAGLEDAKDFKRALEYLQEGKLNPAHIDAMARRKLNTIFLNHLHQVMYCLYYRTYEVPAPYAISILQHAHMIEIPNYDVFVEEMTALGVPPREKGFYKLAK